jgi:hypothetical protein
MKIFIMKDVEFENKFDREACKKLAKDISDGLHDCDEWESLVEILEFYRVQPRFKDDPKHVRALTHKIKNGSVDNCKPIAIFEKWEHAPAGAAYDGDTMINGSHTSQAAHRVKEEKLRTARVPKHIADQFNLNEARFIGNLLNPRKEFITLETSVETAAKMVVNRVQSGTDKTDPDIKEMLNDMGFYGTELGSVTRLVNQELKKSSNIRAGYTFKDYQAIARFKTELRNKVASFKNETTVAFAMSSEYFKMEKILSDSFEMTQIGKKNKIVVVIYHISRDSSEHYKNDSKMRNLRRITKHFVELNGHNLVIKEMSMWEKDA